MALARIISHSQQCCRELAVDLLARGYAVEIVSPDEIPDNFADLELRVETDAMNDLTAKVAARNGERSTFLDFVYHLRTPMEDFVRRPHGVDDTAAFPAAPIDFNAEQSPLAEVEAPASTPTIATETASVSVLCTPEPDLEEPGHLSPAPEQIPLPVQQECERPKRGVTIVFHQPWARRIKLKTPAQSAGLLRVAAGFVLVVALSAIPIVGITGGGPLVQSAAADSPKVVPANAGSSAMKDAHPATVTAATSTSAPQTGNRDLSQASVLPKTKGTSKGESASGKLNDLREDVAVYRDKPVSKTASKTRQQKTRHAYRDDSVAEDTVTYLDRRLTPNRHLP